MVTSLIVMYIESVPGWVEVVESWLPHNSGLCYEVSSLHNVCNFVIEKAHLTIDSFLIAINANQTFLYSGLVPPFYTLFLKDYYENQAAESRISVQVSVNKNIFRYITG